MGLQTRPQSDLHEDMGMLSLVDQDEDSLVKITSYSGHIEYVKRLTEGCQAVVVHQEKGQELSLVLKTDMDAFEKRERGFQNFAERLAPLNSASDDPVGCLLLAQSILIKTGIYIISSRKQNLQKALQRQLPIDQNNPTRKNSASSARGESLHYR